VQQPKLAGIIADLALLADVATVRNSPGGEDLSRDAVVAIALLLSEYARPGSPDAA
jgi:hypothetical protein